MRPDCAMLVAAASVACGGRRTIGASAAVDWAELARLALAHKVVPVVAPTLAPHVPADAREWWRHETHAHARRVLLMTSVLDEVLARLRDRGLRALAVKGPVLGALLYDQPMRRTFVDLDLWIARRDLAAAAACVIGAGFEAEPSLIEAVRRPSRFVQAAVSLTRGGLTLELHGEALIRFADHTFDFDTSWERRREVSIGPAAVPTLDAADTLHYLCLHGDWHTWERLQWIADVAMAAARIEADAARSLIARATDAGHDRVLRVALRIADEVIGAEMAAPLNAFMQATDDVADRMVRQVIDALGSGSAIVRAADRFRFHVGGRRGRALRHYLLWSAASASAADVAEAKLPPQLSWLYPAWRLPRLLWRYARPTSPPATRA